MYEYNTATHIFAAPHNTSQQQSISVSLQDQDRQARDSFGAKDSPPNMCINWVETFVCGHEALHWQFCVCAIPDLASGITVACNNLRNVPNPNAGIRGRCRRANCFWREGYLWHCCKCRYSPNYQVHCAGPANPWAEKCTHEQCLSCHTWRS